MTPTFVASRSPKTPKIVNPVIRNTTGNSRSQTNWASGSPRTPNNQNFEIRSGRSRVSTTTPETPRSSRNDPNGTISADPAVMKRGRVEYGSKKSTKKHRITESNTIANIDEPIDLDETQIQFGSQATPRTSTIRCSTAGTSRSQSTRGSMFQAPQASNSVFTFRSRSKDANQTISADPAVKERGQVQKFNETFFEDDSDNF